MFCFGVGAHLPMVCSDGHFQFNSFSSGSNSSSANNAGLGGAGRTWEMALILPFLRTLSQMVWSSSVLGVNFLHFPMSELLQGKVSSLNNHLVVTAEAGSRGVLIRGFWMRQAWPGVLGETMWPISSLFLGFIKVTFSRGPAFCFGPPQPLFVLFSFVDLAFLFT